MKSFNFNKEAFNSKNLLLLGLLAVLFTSGVISCGPKTVANTVENSGSNSFASTSVSTSTNTTNADCSRDVDNQSAIGITAMSAYTSYYNTYDSTRLHVRFDRFPSTFSNYSNSALRFYGFTYDSSGNATAHQLNFSLETKSGSTFTALNGGATWSEISSADLVTAANNAGISGTTAAAVLSSLKFNLVLDWTNLDMITAVTYENNSASVTNRVDVLKPRFLANPTEYNNTGRPLVLQKLHPLYNYLSSGWTTSQYKSQTDTLCY